MYRFEMEAGRAGTERAKLAPKSGKSRCSMQFVLLVASAFLCAVGWAGFGACYSQVIICKPDDAAGTNTTKSVTVAPTIAAVTPQPTSSPTPEQQQSKLLLDDFAPHLADAIKQQKLRPSDIKCSVDKTVKPPQRFSAVDIAKMQARVQLLEATMDVAPNELGGGKWGENSWSGDDIRAGLSKAKTALKLAGADVIAEEVNPRRITDTIELKPDEEIVIDVGICRSMFESVTKTQDTSACSMCACANLPDRAAIVAAMPQCGSEDKILKACSASLTTIQKAYAKKPKYVDALENYIADRLIKKKSRARRRLDAEPNWWKDMPIHIYFNDEIMPKTEGDVRAAIAHIEANSCVQFKFDYPGWFTDRIEVIYEDDDNACGSSPIGIESWGWHQYLKMKATCGVYTAVHELFHALGIAHEQMRTDAEEYLNINGDQIMKGYHHNFIKDDDTGWMEARGVPFDYRSFMMYPRYAFNKCRDRSCNQRDLPKSDPNHGVFDWNACDNDCPFTMEPNRIGVDSIELGQRRTATALDFAKLKILYQCSSCASDKDCTTKEGPFGADPNDPADAHLFQDVQWGYCHQTTLSVNIPGSANIQIPTETCAYLKSPGELCGRDGECGYFDAKAAKIRSGGKCIEGICAVCDMSTAVTASDRSKQHKICQNHLGRADAYCVNSDCGIAAALGGPCEDQVACIIDANISYNVFRAFPENGLICSEERCSECERDSQCANNRDGFYGYCARVAISASGDRTVVSDGGVGVCLASKGIGATCDRDQQCRGGSFCARGRCTMCNPTLTTAMDNPTCGIFKASRCPVDSPNCALTCAQKDLSASYECMPLKDFGRYCAHSKECASNKCHQNVCQECLADSECASSKWCRKQILDLSISRITGSVNVGDFVGRCIDKGLSGGWCTKPEHCFVSQKAQDNTCYYCDMATNKCKRGTDTFGTAPNQKCAWPCSDGETFVAGRDPPGCYKCADLGIPPEKCK